MGPHLSQKQLFCQIRHEWVAATPEEWVRQRLIDLMLSELDFPRSLLVVEKSLRMLPHLSGESLPDRRVDLICFAKEIDPVYDLYPLIVIECKAVRISDKVLSQVVGYNHYVKAYFVAVANGETISTGWYDRTKQDYTFIHGLPKYQKLLQAVSSDFECKG